MNIGERIKLSRSRLKMTQQQLGDRIGANKASISQWENGVYTPDAKNLSALAKALSVSVFWLMDGKGDPAGQNLEIAPPDIHRIPVISYVQAGVWTETSEIREYDGNLVYITTDLELGERAFAIELKGHSMEPEFVEGDIVLIDPDEHPHPGDFVVAKNGEEAATFKKYRPRGVGEDGQEVFELVPLNDDFPTMRSDRQHIHIIGTMVEHRRRRKRR
ncbi:helix-turn-helix domain-containing protein [Aeromonas media]|uniref:Helix-turn-helix domain-containing protein n=1 Tax=Aeromonas media TaxID=651 RepID=A0ABX6NW82_AERME|nr:MULTISPECIES: S24 family peptidase [Aeromonas]ATP90368.1 LexA family transcriptional repressor [Aeromonas caviae]QJT34453.1 helix-turn-helix domain-containing protein [Aeromonas media]QJT40029.1 helix-turn-helix domain-containing protein [Aeromonas media]